MSHISEKKQLHEWTFESVADLELKNVEILRNNGLVL